MSNLAVVDTAPRPSLVAGGRPTAIVPNDMDSAYRLAKAVCMAGMAPKGLDTPEKAMVAIMHGLEIGLTPMAALQRIAVVNGRPTIWGDGAIGLVRGSGLCEYVKEWIEGDGDKRTAFCEVKRKGEPTPVKRSFSVADAKKAGLWGKSGPWQQYEERMLQMRARAFCLRDVFADVLGGLYLREEIEEDNGRAAPPTPPPAPIVARVVEREKPTPPTPPVPPKAITVSPKETAPKPEPAREEATLGELDPEALRKRFLEAANTAQDIDALNEAWERIVRPVENELFPPDHEDFVGIFRKRERELEP